MNTIHARWALLAEGWAREVRLGVDAGRVTFLQAGVVAEAGDDRHDVVIPGMPNVHSHAFQRGMAGLAEVAGPAADTFWTWREQMYRFALAMTPDQLEAVAAQLYVELLEAGFTRVGEFHYLHHDRDGSSYADLAELAGRIAAASARTGLQLTLLPVFYAHAGFGGTDPAPGQRRFITHLDQFARLVEASREIVAGLEGGTIGVAPHSLRAVTPDELREMIALQPHGPIHIHAAEQRQEVADCLAWSGQRPVEWLLAHAAVDARWCLIHATHMTEAETAGLATSGAVAGLCPVTEANLGDGTFPARTFQDKGGRFGIGTDSNLRISVADELRQLEYSQRLARGERNVLAPAGGSTGRALVDAALAGGAQALGTGPASIAQDATATLVALRAGLWEGDDPDAMLDAWIFARGVEVDAVWVGGRQVVTDGRHVHRDAVAADFRRAMRELLAAS